MECCKCGSIKIYGVCTNRRCPELDAKAKKWIINGKECGFKIPVTKSEARKAVAEGLDIVVRKVAVKPISA